MPIYADPDVVPEIWVGALASPAGSIVILNPDSGSGKTRDLRYAERVARAHEGGLEVLGYVDTGYGARPPEAVMADVDQYVSWYGVDGVFFDQASGALARLGHYRSITAAARARGLAVALNMGVPDVHSGYAEIADVLGVFEGAPDAHRAARFPSWMSDPTRLARLWHLVFDVPSEREMRDTLARAAEGPCDVIFVTDGRGPNPWSHLPGYWTSQLAALDASGSGAPGPRPEASSSGPAS
jgi:hypothetical protein